MAKAFSYLRFSTPEQSKGDSLRRQSDLARAYADRHGLDLDESSYRDLGVSSFRGTNARTGALGQFLAAVDSGAVPAGAFLLVENLDRVSRQDPWDALPVFQQIINAGVTIVTLQDGRAWSREEMRANPMRLFESLFTMVRAHEESETKSRRLKASWAARRSTAAVKPITSRGPAWLKFEDGRWVVIDERAAIVRRIFTLAAAGQGENSIAAELNRDSKATWGDNGRPAASMWRKSYVSKILRSEAVVGTLVPHTMKHEGELKRRQPEAHVVDYYPRIVDRELYGLVSSLKGTANPARGRHAAQPVQNIVGGIARCLVCGEAMTRVYKGTAAKAGPPKLVCVGAKTGAGCAYIPVPCDAVEAAIKANFRSIAEGGPQSEYAEDAGVQIARNEARIAEILATVDAMFKTGGVLRQADAFDIVAKLNDEKRDLYGQIDNLRAYGQQMAEPVVKRRLDELEIALAAEPLDVGAANVALRGLFDRIVVDARKAELSCVWKTGETTMIPVVVEDRTERLRRHARSVPRSMGGQFQGERATA